MWRALFLAVGIVITIVGAECLVIDEAVMIQDAPKATKSIFLTSSTPGVSRRVVRPPESAPWVLLSAGIVVLLYSVTIPQRLAG